jgi:hypothetical protein
MFRVGVHRVSIVGLKLCTCIKKVHIYMYMYYTDICSLISEPNLSIYALTNLSSICLLECML